MKRKCIFAILFIFIFFPSCQKDEFSELKQIYVKQYIALTDEIAEGGKDNSIALLIGAEEKNQELIKNFKGEEVKAGIEQLSSLWNKMLYCADDEAEKEELIIFDIKTDELKRLLKYREEVTTFKLEQHEEINYIICSIANANEQFHLMLK